MAAPPPFGGGGPPILPVPAPIQHSYINYLNDASNDPYAALPNGYSNALQPFAIDTNNANNNVTPDVVRNLVLAAPGAVPLLLFHNNRIHVYLQPSRMEPRLGHPASQWDNRMFVTKGDLHNNTAVHAEWLMNYFHQGQQNVTCATVDTIVNAFAADNNLAAFGPYGNNDPGTEVIRVRNTCFCPAPYAAMLLATPLTPRTAFTILHTQIVNDNKLVECEALLRWLRCCLLVNANGHSPVEVAPPTAPLADTLLLDHRRWILERDFPLLNQILPQLQQHQIAQSINQLVADTQAHRQAEAQRKAAERIKLPSTLFGTAGVSKLCRLLRVPDEQNLPTIYTHLASASRHNCLNIVQDALNQERTRLRLSRLHLVATPSLLQKLTTVAWEMDHLDIITSGIQPFIFGEVTPEESQRMSQFYQLVMSGTAAPNLDDAAILMSPGKPTLPRQLFQTKEMLQRLLVIYNVFFLPTHHLSLQLADFLLEFNNRESALHHYVPHTPGYTLCMPLLIIQWCTIRLNNWYRDQSVSDAPVLAPDFTKLFNLIDLHERWEPPLHPQLLASFAPISYPSPGISSNIGEVGGGSGNYNRLGGGNENGGDNGGNNSGGNVNPIPNATIRNAQWKSSFFQRFRDMNINHGTLRQSITVRPPNSPFQSDGEMCLSFHIKGICNQRCSRAFDHRPHTDAQDRDLVAWCNDHYHL